MTPTAGRSGVDRGAAHRRQRTRWRRSRSTLRSSPSMARSSNIWKSSSLLACAVQPAACDVDAVEPDRAPTRNATGSSVTLAAKSAGVIVSKRRLGLSCRPRRALAQDQESCRADREAEEDWGTSDGRDQGRPALKNDRRHAVFDVRACPDHSGSVNNLACRLALDGQVMAERRFPPPWDIEDNGACFIVRDHSGHVELSTMRTNPAGVLRQICSRATKRGASPAISRNLPELVKRPQY